LLKYSTNSGRLNTKARYSLHEVAASWAIISRHAWSHKGSARRSRHFTHTQHVHTESVLQTVSWEDQCSRCQAWANREGAAGVNAH
jgi:hypothetical protein